MEGALAGAWPKGIGAITLFVEDLAAARQFYLDVFGLPVMFEDDDSTVFDFGNTIVNLLKATAAPELVEPARVAPREAGSRFQLTLNVDDVDVMCAELARRGVTLLNGPDGPAMGRANRQLHGSRAATSGRSPSSDRGLPAGRRRRTRSDARDQAVQRHEDDVPEGAEAEGRDGRNVRPDPVLARPAQEQGHEQARDDEPGSDGRIAQDDGVVDPLSDADRHKQPEGRGALPACAGTPGVTRDPEDGASDDGAQVPRRPANDVEGP